MRMWIHHGFAAPFMRQMFLGHVCAEFAHGAHGIPLHCPFHELILDGREHAAEVRSETLDGDFLVRVTPLRDSQGEIAYVLHSMVEVTERHRAEAALRASEERFRGYFDQSLVGVAVTSPAKGWITPAARRWSRPTST